MVLLTCWRVRKTRDASFVSTSCARTTSVRLLCQVGVLSTAGVLYVLNFYVVELYSLQRMQATCVPSDL